MDNWRRTRDRGKLSYDSRRIGDVYLHRLVLASVITDFTAPLTNRTLVDASFDQIKYNDQVPSFGSPPVKYISELMEL